MKLLRHYLKTYGLIIRRSHGCPTLSLLYAYSKLIFKAHWVHKFRSSIVGPHTISLFGYQLFFPSYVFLLHQFEEIFVLDIYRSNQKPPQESLIIDGGSHVGVSLLYFITCYPQAKIISFEPDPNVFKLLRQFVSQNGLHQVTLINAALNDKPGSISFFTHTVSGRLDAGAYNTSMDTVALQVPAVVLSDYVSFSVGLLKLDIEGAEVKVLEELVASEKIALVQEIILEFHPAIHPSPTYLIELLAKAGFHVRQLNSAALYDLTQDYLLHFSRSGVS